MERGALIIRLHKASGSEIFRFAAATVNQILQRATTCNFSATEQVVGGY